jgi:hypothetical protein
MVKNKKLLKFSSRWGLWIMTFRVEVRAGGLVEIRVEVRVNVMDKIKIGIHIEDRVNGRMRSNNKYMYVIFKWVY